MKLSVIIPTLNRANLLLKALDSLLHQTFSQEFFEVIVVDNGSNDETKEVVESFNGKIKNLVYIYDQSPGLHIGRHQGLLASHSNILVYADDDIKAFPSWLEAIYDSFSKSDVALVGGKNIPEFEETPPQWIYESWLQGGDKKMLSELSILDFGDKEIDISPLYVFGCNFSIRKDILLQAGGFHPDGMPFDLIRYRGDGETFVSEYILSKGYRTIYNPKASVYHFVPKKRLNKEYFFHRAYIQAISDSYTSVRNNKKSYIFIRVLKFYIKKYIFLRDVEIERSYLKGYLYHQKEVNSDSDLLSWIKRESYVYDGKIN